MLGEYYKVWNTINQSVS